VYFAQWADAHTVIIKMAETLTLTNVEAWLQSKYYYNFIMKKAGFDYDNLKKSSPNECDTGG